MQPRIIIFTGLPGTGKTTLSRSIANALKLPLIAKDDIKEIMYDHIGWSDKAFSAKLVHATFGIMDLVTEQQLKNGFSVILESNYAPKLASEKFRNWQQQYNCILIQIVCQTDIDILAHRFLERQRTNRHPGHNDTGTIESLTANYIKRIENHEDQPLDLDGPTRIIDTSDFSTVDSHEITTWIQSHLSSKTPM